MGDFGLKLPEECSAFPWRIRPRQKSSILDAGDVSSEGETTPLPSGRRDFVHILSYSSSGGGGEVSGRRGQGDLCLPEGRELAKCERHLLLF